MSAGPGDRLTRWFVANSDEVLLALVGVVVVVLLALAGLPYYGDVLGVSGVAGVRTVAVASLALTGGASWRCWRGTWPSGRPVTAGRVPGRIASCPGRSLPVSSDIT